MSFLKKCKTCGIEALCYEDLNLFSDDKRLKHGKQNKCKDCDKKRTKEWKKKNVERVREWNRNNPDRRKDYVLRSTYGISLNEYNDMVDNQESCCKICDKLTKKLYVDHCHNTGRVRGLLCHKCNTALGLFEDSIYSLKNAIVYLKS